MNELLKNKKYLVVGVANERSIAWGIAQELKQQGAFLARTLSWDGSETGTERVSLTLQQKQTYDRAVQWWRRAKIKLEQAMTLT